MRPLQIVIDTNILVAGLRSNKGYAYDLLQLVGTGLFEIHLSVPLVMEYESTLRRLLPDLPVPESVVLDVIEFHCAVAHRHKIFFLWRPFLRDPKDEMVLELAVKANCDAIVTYNKADFKGVESFGLSLWEPRELLEQLNQE